VNADSPTGVIFDMDGVLIDSAEPHLESWRRLAEECGGSVTREQFAATFGRQNRDIIPILFGEVSEDRTQVLSERKEEIYRDLVRERPPIVPGAVELVCGLKEAGAGLAVGSSGPMANVKLVVGAMGVGELISVIVSGDDVSRGKPDPQVFTVACERLGLAPGRCVVVEDAPAGVTAARAAGARAVAILMHHPADAFDGADLIVDRLGDLSVKQLISLAGGA
jgi:beta-phosphoglucomutase